MHMKIGGENTLNSAAYKKNIFTFIKLSVAVLATVYLLPPLLKIFMPFVIGFLIASASQPIVNFLEKKIKIRRKAGAAVIIVFSIGVVVALSYFVLQFLVFQFLDFVGTFPAIIQSASKSLTEVKNNFESVVNSLPLSISSSIYSGLNKMTETAGETINSMSASIMSKVSSFAQNVPTIFLSTVVCVLSAYFFISDKKKFSDFFNKIIPDSTKKIVFMVVNGTKKAFLGYFVAQIKIELCVYICLVVGFFLLKIDFVWIISLGIAFLDFLPIFGTGTAMVPWAIIEIVSGNYMQAIGLLILWAVSQILRQFLQPRFVSNSVGLSELSTLILMYLGFVLGGVIGMIVSVPLGIVIYSLYKDGIFDESISEIKAFLSNAQKNFGTCKLHPDKEKILSEEQIKSKDSLSAVYIDGVMHPYSIYYSSRGYWVTTVRVSGKRKYISCKTKNGLLRKLEQHYSSIANK